MKDFFISYKADTTTDKHETDWAEWVASVLEDHGSTVVSSTSMAATYQHMTDPARHREQLEGLLWTACESDKSSSDDDGEPPTAFIGQFA